MGIPYTTPEGVKKLIASDVSCVQKNARFLFTVDKDGYLLNKQVYPDAPLNVIAVIGPATCLGSFFDTALLLEVGLSHTRPYHEARIPDPDSGGKRESIAKRRNYSLLSKERFGVL
jgi:hypothetical protein